jgi:gamma-butyrobetaine dioxygenase
LIDASVGGDSGLVDGFQAAAPLRLANPDAFTTLTSAVPLAFADQIAELSTWNPLTDLDPEGISARSVSAIAICSRCAWIAPR